MTAAATQSRDSRAWSHLNAAEFDRWLLTDADDNRPLPANAQTPIGALRRFSVPNEIRVFVAAGVTSDPSLAILTLRAINEEYMAIERHGGCKVIVTESRDTGLFRSLWQDRAIYGFHFVGHGSEYGLTVDAWSNDAVRPDQVTPPYKLAIIAMLACYSADPVFVKYGPGGDPVTAKWVNHLSDTGFFAGAREIGVRP